MPLGELLTRASIWLALCGYTAGAICLLVSRRSAAPALWRRHARGAWTAACVCFLAHVLFAFGAYHGWSHRAAYESTARQVAEVTGWPLGEGLYVNYLFLAAWLADVVWWWLAPGSHARRPRALTLAWHAFVLFIVFNATVVFAHGPARILGLAICLSLWLASSLTRPLS